MFWMPLVLRVYDVIIVIICKGLLYLESRCLLGAFQFAMVVISAFFLSSQDTSALNQSPEFSLTLWGLYVNA